MYLVNEKMSVIPKFTANHDQTFAHPAFMLSGLAFRQNKPGKHEPNLPHKNCLGIIILF